ncbi:DUF4185 domain-containing protein [Corynebacterium aquilae]|uniref:DUF4185 domain-containing protein n=1 Tax=Corynebacterium aquilae TaxID=203263 RepID=UPI000B1E5EDC|nr:DUF4185 domain-containing protein [Corynebacterium aquilae]
MRSLDPQKTTSGSSSVFSRRVTSLVVSTALVPVIAVSTAVPALADPCSTYNAAVNAEIARLRALGEIKPGSFSSSGLSSSEPEQFDPHVDDPAAFEGTGKKLPPWIRGNPGQLPVIKGHTEALHLLTGPGSPQRTHRSFRIGGTDLGIAFDDSAGNTYLVFGDTMGCGSSLDWRSNALLRTKDHNYADQLTGLQALTPSGWSSQGYAREFIPSLKEPGVEHTTIPTAGVEVNGVLYVDYMSVRSWGAPGEWTTNYAATMRSTDGGRTWRKMVDSERINPQVRGAYGTSSRRVRVGDEKTQMSAFVKADGYVYRYSTPSGRGGSAIVSRVKQADFPDESAFEFLVGDQWVKGAPNLATPVFDAPVSEMSVSYNDFLRRYTAMYYTNGGLVLRTSTTPYGPWSEQRVVVDTGTIPGLYGGFLLPRADSKYLYFVATTWDNYNVMLMRTDLEQLTSHGARGLRSAVPMRQSGQPDYDPRVDDGLTVVDWVRFEE